MKNRTFLILLVGMVCVGLLSACAGIGSSASGGSNNPPRILSVTGIGKVNISPDIAYINIGVHTEADTVA
ncbi:MAG: hypothetical protein HGA82_02045, partial [Anaerolineales bacterium]|nr:hypothetical protein [Anaerolineales bacterium]